MVELYTINFFFFLFLELMFDWLELLVMVGSMVMSNRERKQMRNSDG